MFDRRMDPNRKLSIQIIDAVAFMAILVLAGAVATAWLWPEAK